MGVRVTSLSWTLYTQADPVSTDEAQPAPQPTWVLDRTNLFPRRYQCTIPPQPSPRSSHCTDRTIPYTSPTAFYFAEAPIMGTITQACWNTPQAGGNGGILPTFSNNVRSALNDSFQSSVWGQDAIFHTKSGPHILCWLALITYKLQFLELYF